MEQAEHTHIREVRVNYTPTTTERFTLSDARGVADFVREVLPDNSREHFVALYLDGKHSVASYSLISTGLANFSVVHPREVFQRAVLSGACAIVISHNHPSGNLEASSEDWAATHRIKKAGELLGIKLLDHVIVTDSSQLSLRAMARWDQD